MFQFVIFSVTIIITAILIIHISSVDFKVKWWCLYSLKNFFFVTVTANLNHTLQMTVTDSQLTCYAKQIPVKRELKFTESQQQE